MKGKVIKKPGWMILIGVRAIALFPYIILTEYERDKNHKTLINHEQIHIRQQLEMLVIPFYLVYLLHYVWNLFTKGKGRYNSRTTNAYKNIVFEKEANSKERDLAYLDRRKFWSWTKYFNVDEKSID
jgi:hypothetical protein